MSHPRSAPSLDSLRRRFRITPPGRTSAPQGWTLDDLSGRLVEISGSASSASLTIGVSLVLEAQRRGEPAAWVTTRESSIFPPDLATAGIDLEALPVVRVESAPPGARAAEILLRSGGFLLIVCDLGPKLEIPIPSQTRLTGLATKHRTTLLFLTRKDREVSSLGSLISLRGESTKRRTDFDRFAWELEALKDKKRGPGWRHGETCHGPHGLC